MPNKTQNQRFHAKRRALERYGLALNRKDLEAVVRRIQRGEATFVERQSCRVSEFLIDIDGQPCRVIYDRQRKTIVTFLPPEEPCPAQ